MDSRGTKKSTPFLYANLFLVSVHEATDLMRMPSTSDLTTRRTLKILQITSPVIIIVMTHTMNSLAGIE
jgi:hypothetical protein